ncbi:MAG: hypothetical protein ABIJ45_06735 [Candidatus Zixiibacteriota bacterium]
MSKKRSADECPRCGSNYLDIKHQRDNGEMIVICEECGHEFKAFGKPTKKIDKPRRSNYPD